MMSSYKDLVYDIMGLLENNGWNTNPFAIYFVIPDVYAAIASRMIA